MLLGDAPLEVNRCNPPSIFTCLYIHGGFTVLLPATDASARRYTVPQPGSTRRQSELCSSSSGALILQKRREAHWVLAPRSACRVTSALVLSGCGTRPNPFSAKGDAAELVPIETGDGDGGEHYFLITLDYESNLVIR